MAIGADVGSGCGFTELFRSSGDRTMSHTLIDTRTASVLCKGLVRNSMPQGPMHGGSCQGRRMARSRTQAAAKGGGGGGGSKGSTNPFRDASNAGGVGGGRGGGGGFKGSGTGGGAGSGVGGGKASSKPSGAPATKKLAPEPFITRPLQVTLLVSDVGFCIEVWGASSRSFSHINFLEFILEEL